MTNQVKICGLTRLEDVLAADQAGADYLGFIFAKSPRRITPEHAKTISEGVRAKRVAVVVEPTADELSTLLDTFAPDLVQFHGDEAPESVLRVAADHGVGVIKAVPIAETDDMKWAERYAACDLILYDAKPPTGSDVRGGHGTAIDWDVIANSPRPKHFALAGGLTPANVAEALAKTGATVADTSSGVELSPGVKDADAIAAFIRAAKRAGKGAEKGT